MSMHTPAVPVLLTANQVAEMLGWGLDTVYRRVREGLLPTVKIGKRKFFHRAKLEQFLLQGGAVATIATDEAIAPCAPPTPTLQPTS